MMSNLLCLFNDEIAYFFKKLVKKKKGITKSTINGTYQSRLCFNLSLFIFYK